MSFVGADHYQVQQQVSSNQSVFVSLSLSLSISFEFIPTSKCLE